MCSTRPEHLKGARLWQSLQRLSDSGRFSRTGIKSHNPIIAALCVQVVGQVTKRTLRTPRVGFIRPVEPQ